MIFKLADSEQESEVKVRSNDNRNSIEPNTNDQNDVCSRNIEDYVYMEGFDNCQSTNGSSSACEQNLILNSSSLESFDYSLLIGKLHNSFTFQECFVTFGSLYARFTNDVKNVVYDCDKQTLVYEGDWTYDNGIGKGIQYYHNRDKSYVGGFANGLKHGKGVEFYHRDEIKITVVNSTQSGLVFYDGDWKNGDFDGYGTLYNDYGVMKYQGAWKNGQRHGKGLLYHGNGKKAYEGFWSECQRDGKGCSYDSQGKRLYEGSWKNDQESGAGKFYFLEKSSALQCIVGKFENGLNGYIIAYDYDNYIRYKGQFYDGKINGWGVEYDYEGNKRYEG